MYPPKMSARRPAGSRNAPVTREKTLAGHVSACDGMSSAWVNVGSRTLNPETKYSATNMDPRREKQNPSSTHIVLKASGRSRPSLSISEGVYEHLGVGVDRAVSTSSRGDMLEVDVSLLTLRSWDS